MIIKIIGAIVMLIGVILLYNSREIVKKIFGFGDQNEATLGLKMVGFVVSVIGSLIILLN